MPFVKLDTGILASTIWFLSPEREIFITSLLLAQPREFPEPVPTLFVDRIEETGFVVPPGWYGFVAASGPGIVHAAHIGNEADGIAALKKLAEPEPDSRSQDFDGRRMVRIDGGYLVLNFMRYRDKDHTANERQRRLRERKKGNVTRDTVTVTRDVTQSESREQRAQSRIQSTEGIQYSDPSPPPEPKQGAKAPRVFVPPTPDEVTAYSAEIGFPLDGSAWCDSYAQKGWTVGKGKMKDWKAAVRTWKNNGWKPTGSASTSSPANGNRYHRPAATAEDHAKGFLHGTEFDLATPVSK